MKLTPAQILLAKHLEELGIATIAEYRFCPVRQFRLDLYAPEHRLGFECNGTFNGLHGSRYSSQDREKSNIAQMMGIRVLVFSNQEVMKGKAQAFVREWYGTKGEPAAKDT